MVYVFLLKKITLFGFMTPSPNLVTKGDCGLWRVLIEVEGWFNTIVTKWSLGAPLLGAKWWKMLRWGELKVFGSHSFCKLLVG